ncbi:hypothetical protein MHUMG1_01319 [Metarhizium humberi]|uniref:Uncharacterized protein n=1 Tax=Metarhizium humberi TaxID=2596975 RepID=A0A9P8MH50_9HYPO|nr:hypothetical protein MHUMG1_01319 [Metarhizium humberi]
MPVHKLAVLAVASLKSTGLSHSRYDSASNALGPPDGEGNLNAFTKPVNITAECFSHSSNGTGQSPSPPRMPYTVSHQRCSERRPSRAMFHREADSTTSPDTSDPDVQQHGKCLHCKSWTTSVAATSEKTGTRCFSAA